MIGTSEWAAKFLKRHPILLDELLDNRNLNIFPDWSVFAQDCRRQMETIAGNTERQLDLLRELHHVQLFRLLAQDLEGKLSVEVLAEYLSVLADILVDTTIHSVWQTFSNHHHEVPKFAVIAYGKLSGKELSYASDLDVVFCMKMMIRGCTSNVCKVGAAFYYLDDESYFRWHSVRY